MIGWGCLSDLVQKDQGTGNKYRDERCLGLWGLAACVYGQPLVSMDMEGPQYHTILYKGLKHPWTLVSAGVLDLIPMGTKD